MPKSQGKKITKKSRVKDKPYSRSTQDGSPPAGSDDPEEPPICPVCDAIIKEPSDDGQVPGDEALFCEGKCEAWYYRKCVGVSKCAYNIASESENPFYCLLCMQAHYINIIVELKDQINTLTSKINQPPAATNSSSGQQPANGVDDQQPSATSVPVTITSSVTTASTKPYSDRKFNVVLFGLAECPTGTKKFDRDQSDLKNVTEIFSELDNSIQSFSIRDTIRLGKYNPSGRSRPLLVTLNRSSDVTTILSKRAQIKSPYVVKADLPKEARDVESHLLKARWSLIQANTPKTDIRIRGNKLYIKGVLHGQADSTGFRPTLASTDKNTSASPTTATSMDTSTSIDTSSA